MSWLTISMRSGSAMMRSICMVSAMTRPRFSHIALAIFCRFSSGMSGKAMARLSSARWWRRSKRARIRHTLAETLTPTSSGTERTRAAISRSAAYSARNCRSSRRLGIRWRSACLLSADLACVGGPVKRTAGRTLAGDRVHEARHGSRSAEPALHQQPPQRADVGKQMQPEAAQGLRRQEIGEQRAVEKVDRDGAREHVRSTRRMVVAQHFLAADVAAVRMRGGSAVGERRRVAQAEIEALGADRRDHVRGLADQRYAPLAHAVGMKAGEGVDGAWSDAHEVP